MAVIHFLDLEDLIAELDPAMRVRVNVIPLTVYVYVDPSMSLVQIGVHVRQITSDKDVLSWMIPTGEYETYQGEPHQKRDGAILELAQEEAAVIKEMVIERIKSEYSSLGFDIKIRPGIIDLGRSAPIMGHWSLLEVTREEVEEQPEETNTQEDDEDEIPF